MVDFRPPPDIEAALVAHLKASSGVTTLTGSKISTELPASFKAEKRVKLSATGGSDVVAGALDRPLIIVHCFGATKGEAHDVAAATYVALCRLAGKTVGDVFVSDVEEILRATWSPDPDTDIPRYLMTFAIVARSVA